MNGHDTAANPCISGFSDLTDYQNTGTIYKPVEHSKWAIQYGGHASEYDSSQTHGYFTLPGKDTEDYYVHVSNRRVWDAATGYFPNLLKIPDWKGHPLWFHRFDGHLNYAYALKPSLNTGFSLLNFLLQWKDVVHIFEHYLAKGAMRKTFNKIMKEFWHSPSAGAREIANQRLEWEYGTKQFFQDLHHIMSIMTTWKQIADEFIHNAGKARYITRAIRGPGTPPWFDPSIFVPWKPFGASDGTDGKNGLRYQKEVSIESHLSVVYSYNTPAMSGFLSRLAQLSDSFGVSLDASIIWDAIPFSFVVDWFTNVGEWLHRQRKDLYNMEVTYREYGLSAKFSVAQSVVLYAHGPYVGQFPDYQSQVFVGGTTFVHYERNLVDLPSSALPTAFDNPNRWTVHRILNATALCLQRFLKHSGHG
jgi:hypothetical protein